MKKIAVIGAGIVGICTSYFLQKSGFKVTLIDKEDPGTMTSYGHACTFADYANVPVNNPDLFFDIPKMLLRKDGPLSVDFLYIIKNIPWALQFLKNCQKNKVEEIAFSLANLLHHSRLAYDNIFKDVDVSKFLKNEENIYIYNSKKSFEISKYSNELRKKNNIKVRELNKNDIYDLEPNLAPIYYAGYLFIGSRHTTNPLAISKKIFQSFLQAGGEFINESVKNILDKDDLVQINLQEKEIKFNQVVICTGAWSKSLAKMVGDDFPLDTERGYHVLFNNEQQLINRPIGWSQSGFYLVQMKDGIRASGTVEIAGLDKPLNKKRVQIIESQARKILPQLGEVKSTWLGRRPTLPDAKPIIGRSPKNKNVMYAFGHQHIGWTLAAVTGKAINELAKGSQPNFDISAFSPSRFSKLP
ncbi:FAD-binding oxidoreductase [Alphaproteobacteria bacterium]|nr:FAD-binding oxidoreductase [Alphaproteobacteria bacterium]